MNRWMLFVALSGTLAAALLPGGCSKPEEGQDAGAAVPGPAGPAGGPAGGAGSEAAAPPPTAAPGTPGVLSGRVIFEGTVPPPRQIEVTKDKEACAHTASEVQDVVVSSDHGLAGVVVEVQGIALPKDVVAGTYEIRQKDCQFDPPLLVVPDGANLTIYNDDTVLHNINAGQWNLAQPAGFRPLKQALHFLRRPFIRVQCNIHRWMEGWIYVVRSPSYAVTGADGGFRIEGIPPGSYTVAITHPSLEPQSLQVTIPGGGTVEQQVTLHLP